jgi:hypothetical protein
MSNEGSKPETGKKIARSDAPNQDRKDRQATPIVVFYGRAQ